MFFNCIPLSYLHEFSRWSGEVKFKFIRSQFNILHSHAGHTFGPVLPDRVLGEVEVVCSAGDCPKKCTLNRSCLYGRAGGLVGSQPGRVVNLLAVFCDANLWKSGTFSGQLPRSSPGRIIPPLLRPKSPFFLPGAYFVPATKMHSRLHGSFRPYSPDPGTRRSGCCLVCPGVLVSS